GGPASPPSVSRCCTVCGSASRCPLSTLLRRFSWPPNLPISHSTISADGRFFPGFSETIATLPGGWDLAHAIRLGIKPFAELGANSEALSGSQVDSPCSCRAIFESAPVAMLQSPKIRRWRVSQTCAKQWPRPPDHGRNPQWNALGG